VIIAEGKTIAYVWEEAFTKLVKMGLFAEGIATEYDRPGDPLSIDDICVMTVYEPMSEPRIHKCFPGGWDDLVKYVDEVVNGSRDHLSTELSYTYHDRLVNYPGKPYTYRAIGEWGEVTKDAACSIVNQLDRVVELLKKTPYTRRAQTITWIPGTDLYSDEAPCMNSLWFRVIPRRTLWDGIKDQLDMHVRFRSRDAFNAAFMNMYALTLLQKDIADKVGVEVGHYVDFSDSFHVYGSKVQDAVGYVRTIQSRIDNTWTTEEFKGIWEAS
jgi:thymidylate synthase